MLRIAMLVDMLGDITDGSDKVGSTAMASAPRSVDFKDFSPFKTKNVWFSIE